jgi:hypothetical protein
MLEALCIVCRDHRSRRKSLENVSRRSGKVIVYQHWKDVPVGSTAMPVAMPRAPFTRPSIVQALVSTIAGICAVYRKRPGKGILAPWSGSRSKSSACIEERVVDLVRVCKAGKM